MENLMRAAASTIGRRSFFRSLGKFGMGAAAVVGVHLLSKSASAQDPCMGALPSCDNMGGDCQGAVLADLRPCGHGGTKHCVATKPNANGCDWHCGCK